MMSSARCPGWARWAFRHGHALVTACLALGGAALVLYATGPYGPGVSTDGAAYLAGADHLAEGLGFLDYRGEPILWWPPLYPALLAVMKQIFGMTIVAAGRYANALVHGGYIFISARLFRKLMPGRPGWSLAATAFIAVSVSALALAANIGADAAFNLLVVLFLLLVMRWREQPEPRRFWTLTMLAALSPLVRFSAVTLIGAGALLILLAPGRASTRWKQAFLYGGCSSLPLLAWLIGRNLRLYGSLSGSRNLGAIDVLGNLRFALPKLTHWLLPYQVMDRIPAIAMAAAALLLAILFIMRGRPGDIWRRQRARLTPLLIFSTIYLLFVLVTTFTPDHIYIYDDRYYTPLLVPLAGLSGLILSEIVHGLPPTLRKWVSSLALGLFLVWLVYPVHLTSKFVREAREKGVPFYNLHNTAARQEAPFTQALQAFPFEQEAWLYSNFPAAVYLHSGHTADIPPRDAEHPRADPALLEQNVAGWPEGAPAYIIWYLPDDRPMYYDPEQVGTLRRLEPLLELEDGVIYAVDVMD